MDGIICKLFIIFFINSWISIYFLDGVDLQSIDPSERPGAGPEGYAVLKNHPFFRGVDWDNLRDNPSPKLVREPMVKFPIVTSVSNLFGC